MPKPVYVIPGVKHSVTRPVVLDIVRQILKWTGLPEETHTLFAGELDSGYQPGSTISQETKFNNFSSETKWVIKVEEKAQEDRILATSVLYTDNPLIFADHQTHVFMRPSYVPTDVKISIQYKATDETAAQQWIDDIRTRVSMNRDIRQQFVSYSYVLPRELILIAMKIWEMREANEGYGESFDDYWNRNITSKATILSDLVGKNKEWGIAETQARVVGYFDFAGEPEKGDRQADNSSWNIQFSYTFKYDRPVAINMEYPLMIHNELIPQDYRPTAARPRIEDYELSYSATANALAWFEQGRITAPLGTPGIAIPEYDEFYPADGSIYPDTLRVVTALSNIDKDNPLNLLDLNNLGNFQIKPEVIAFMKKEAQYLTKYRYSILNVAVYKNEVMMEPSQYLVDANLMVKFRDAQSLRDTFHVRLSVYQRPRLLTDAAKTRMRNDCAASYELFKALDPTVFERIEYVCLPSDYLTRDTFNQVAHDLDGRFDTQRTQAAYQFNTVMTLFVTANRN